MNTDKSQELNKKLRELAGSNNVYFQPPETLKLNYPCIIFKRSTSNGNYSDNRMYRFKRSYEVVAIDPRPDSKWIDLFLENFRYIRYVRSYTSDNLNHDIFIIYY